MIKGVILMNDKGKPRLVKFYDYHPAEKQQELIRRLYGVFVEAMDKCFSNVRELDIVFNFNKVHAILDEIILGGQVLETSSSEVVKAVEEISKMERAANSLMAVPSITSWQGR